MGVALGDHVLDLAPLAAAEGLDGGHVFESPSLNPFLAMGRPAWSAVRSWLVELLEHEGYRDLVESHLVPRAEVTLHLPFEVADYVDFYSSQHHAENVGRIFRPDGDALTPNWKHLPIGYHGRSGTVVVSGTDVVRPSGQRKPPDADLPSYGPSVRLDIEAEVGFVVGVPSPQGTPVPTKDFRAARLRRVPGQRLERPRPAGLGVRAARAVPGQVVRDLGVAVGRAAGRAARRPGAPGRRRTRRCCRYLERHRGLGAGPRRWRCRWNGTVVSRPPFAGMYWTPDQQLAHLTVNGASLRTGDLYASGTVSGPERDQRGSFLELSWNGSEPVTLDDGSTRTFLEDGDVVSVRPGHPAPTAPGSASARSPAGWSPPAPDRRTSVRSSRTGRARRRPGRARRCRGARRAGRSSSAACPRAGSRAARPAGGTGCWRWSSATRPARPRSSERASPSRTRQAAAATPPPSAAAVSQQPISTTSAAGSWWNSSARRPGRRRPRCRRRRPGRPRGARSGRASSAAPSGVLVDVGPRQVLGAAAAGRRRRGRRTRRRPPWSARAGRPGRAGRCRGRRRLQHAGILARQSKSSSKNDDFFFLYGFWP